MKERYGEEPNRETVQNIVYLYSSLHHVKKQQVPIDIVIGCLPK